MRDPNKHEDDLAGARGICVALAICSAFYLATFAIVLVAGG